MKLLITILATLIIAVSIALVAMDNPGYVLIAVGPWTVETTLVLVTIVAILGFAAIYYSIRFVAGMMGVPDGFRHWRQGRREHKAMLSLTRGLIELAEGHWKKAEKQLLKYVHDGHAPLLNYLAAARAAQAQGADQRRDNYLKQAHESISGADIAVGLTQAELQLQHHQLEQALATLRHLQQLAPKHAQVLKVLSTLYIELADWDHLLELMPSLRKRNVYSDEEIERLSHKAYLAKLGTSTAQTQSVEQLNNYWNSIPKQFRENEEILLNYVQRLVDLGETNQLEPLLRKALNNHRSDALVYYYGLVDSLDTNHQLTMAESLLIGHENDAVTLLTVGRLSLRNKLWGKARSYLEASVSSHPSVEAYNELGNLLEHLGEQDLATKCFKDGLHLAPGCEHCVPIIIGNVAEGVLDRVAERAIEDTISNSLETSLPEPEKT